MFILCVILPIGLILWSFTILILKVTYRILFKTNNKYFELDEESEVKE